MLQTAQTLDTPQVIHRDTLLLVDDDRMLRVLMAEQLNYLGYNVIEAENGQQAWEILQRPETNIEVIILDREMPVMDGMKFIDTIKRDPKLQDKTVIMSTGYGQPEQIKQGITAGVYYYLVKPVNFNVLSTIVRSAIDDANHHKNLRELTKKQENSLTRLTEGNFAIRTLEEAQYVTRLLAQCYENPERVVNGIEALIVNGIEHGNLQVGFDLKKQLLENGNWQQEITRRQNMAENISKKVLVQYYKNTDKHILIITDDGQGFDWKKYLNFDPSRAAYTNGRGIPQARQYCFNELTYNATGNQVIAVVYRTGGTDNVDRQ